MRKSKKEYRCTKCNASSIKWQGFCPNPKCKAAATLELVQLIPVKPKATASQRSLMRRSKNSERNIARTMVAVDGPDLAFEKIASSTGRIGHITNIRVDAISKHYVTENKNRVLPKWMIDAWLLIQQRAIDFNKSALLHLDPPNGPKDFVINGTRRKMSTFCVITQDRHAELIQKERELEELTRSSQEALTALVGSATLS